MKSTKTCRSGRHEYPIEDPSCRECRNERMREVARANPEKGRLKAIEWYYKNKERVKNRGRKHRASIPEKVRGRVLKRYWPDLSPDEAFSKYTQMLISQNNVCASCEKPEIAKSSYSNNIKGLAVDHCHKTGQVRGLLCNRCNVAIGLMYDDIKLLEKAIAYLKKFQ